MIGAIHRKFAVDLLEASPDPILIRDDKGIIVMVNSQAEKMSGYNQDELIGQPLEMLMPERHHQALKEKRANFLKNLRIISTNELDLHIVRKDGTEIPIEMTLAPLQTENGLFICGSIRDISFHKQQEEKLKSMIKDLDAFTYLVSHDLRAPVRHINAFANVLQSEEASKLTDEGKKYLNAIIQSSVKMNQLIDDLLLFSRAGTKQMEKSAVDINSMVAEVIDSFKPDIKDRNIQWTIHELPIVNADIRLLEQVFANVISNAVKYTRPKDPAKIEIGTLEEKEKNGIITFFVKDNGVGFDMKNVDKLFGAFQRLHRGFEGTGVGLANVKRIIIRHGGRVWAEGKVDEGSAFYFTLPR